MISFGEVLALFGIFVLGVLATATVINLWIRLVLWIDSSDRKRKIRK